MKYCVIPVHTHPLVCLCSASVLCLAQSSPKLSEKAQLNLSARRLQQGVYPVWMSLENSSFKFTWK